MLRTVRPKNKYIFMINTCDMVMLLNKIYVNDLVYFLIRFLLVFVFYEYILCAHNSFNPTTLCAKSQSVCLNSKNKGGFLCLQWM